MSFEDFIVPLVGREGGLGCGVRALESLTPEEAQLTLSLRLSLLCPIALGPSFSLALGDGDGWVGWGPLSPSPYNKKKHTWTCQVPGEIVVYSPFIFVWPFHRCTSKGDSLFQEPSSVWRSLHLQDRPFVETWEWYRWIQRGILYQSELPRFSENSPSVTGEIFLPEISTRLGSGMFPERLSSVNMARSGCKY